MNGIGIIRHLAINTAPARNAVTKNFLVAKIHAVENFGKTRRRLHPKEDTKTPRICGKQLRLTVKG